MLNFRNTLIAFIILLAIILLVDLLLPVNIWFYPGIIIALFIILTWGSIAVQSDFYLPSVCLGDSNVRAVALTFDDGPDGQTTPMILDILKEHHVKAAFFIIGKKAEQYPEVIKRIDDEDHIIGGHSYSHHFFFDLFSHKRMQAEMKRTSDIVFSITGKRMQLFRPPYGVTNPTVARALKAMNYISVGWSLKSKDTVLKDDKLILNRMISQVKKGDIILLHDNKPVLISVLGLFISYLKNKEYSIDRLDRFLNINAYVF